MLVDLDRYAEWSVFLRVQIELMGAEMSDV